MSVHEVWGIFLPPQKTLRNVTTSLTAVLGVPPAPVPHAAPLSVALDCSSSSCWTSQPRRPDLMRLIFLRWDAEGGKAGKTRQNCPPDSSAAKIHHCKRCTAHAVIQRRRGCTNAVQPWQREKQLTFEPCLIFFF